MYKPILGHDVLPLVFLQLDPNYLFCETEHIYTFPEFCSFIISKKQSGDLFYTLYNSKWSVYLHQYSYDKPIR